MLNEDDPTDENVRDLHDMIASQHDMIASQRERLGLYGEVLLSLGFDLDDLVSVVGDPATPISVYRCPP